MADLLIHEHKKNDAGSYDNVYRKTKAKLVDTEDGENAEQKFVAMANHIADKNNPHNVTAAQVGAIPSNQKGAPSGVAELDSTGKVPSNQLPSYVDDVLEYGSKSAFPASGETGKIYIATDTNLSYRWSGSQYVEISPSIALGETSSTAYRGDRGKAAYDHISNTNNPHGVTAEQVGARPNTWTPNASEVGADPAGSAAQALQNAKNYADTAAYEKAKEQGYTGTEAEFYAALVSLKDGPFLPLSGGTLSGNLRTNAEIIVGVNKAAFTFEGDTDPLKVWASNIGGEASIKFGGANDYSGGVFQMLETGIVLAESITGYSPNKQTSFVTKKYVDNLLSQLPAPTNLKYGTYVGRGTFGSGSPNSLTLDFNPQLVIITGQHSGSQVAWPLLFMRNNTTAFEMGEGAYTCKVTWNGKIVKWYSTENAGRQMNYNGRTYYYVAIG